MTPIKSILRFIKRRKLIVILIIIIAGIGVYVLRPKPAPPVSTQTVKYTTVTQTVSISGKVSAKKIVDLAFQVGGKLTYLGVQPGDHVKQYQTIATLDTRTAQKNLQASLIDYSKKRNDFDQTQEDNQNRTPNQALNDTMKRVLQDNQFDLDKAVNSVELQSIAAEQSLLTTPIDGIVTRADAKTSGINITPTTIFEVVDPRSLVFDMDVDEADIGKIAIGQESQIVLDTYPDETLKIPVTFIDFVSHTTSTGGNAYTVETVLSDATAMKYRVGMNGNAEIITKEKSNVIAVPIISVVDNKYVYIKTNRGFEKRDVTLGLESDTDVEVKQGLQEGDAVATDPNAAAKQVVK